MKISKLFVRWIPSVISNLRVIVTVIFLRQNQLEHPIAHSYKTPSLSFTRHQNPKINSRKKYPKNKVIPAKAAPENNTKEREITPAKAKGTG